MYNQFQLKDFVDRAIANLSYNTEAERLIEPVRYILSIGGKRLRPVLSLMACNLFTDKIDDAVMPAAGIEVFHNFTLVHDDIIDQAPVRRNVPTVHTKWNINQAVLSGDVMAFVANDCILQTPPRHLQEVFRAFNKAAIEVCAGQQMDMDFEKAATVSEEEYIRMIELKTAALIAAAVQIGAVIGGAEEKDSKQMYDFGRYLGIAFQIQDDLLDVYGDAKVFGKMPGGDIVANKKTFLLIKAFELASRPQLKKLQEYLSAPVNDPAEKVRNVIEIYDELNLKRTTENLAGDYIAKASGLLDRIKVKADRKAELMQMAGNLIGREK